MPDQLFDHLVGEPTRRPIISAWFNNEQLGQPPLDGGQHRYLISGFGDGALVDLCRLTIGSCIVTDSAFRWREIKKAAVSFHPEAYSNIVNRLLLMSSSEKHLPSVPMAFFIEERMAASKT